jgi:alanyl-tRNA synthetase
VGWSLGADSVTVDLSSSPLLTSDQVQKIEDDVNACIRSGSQVSWKLFHRDELAAAHDHPELKDLRGMVKGAALEMEELRLVSIDGLDLNPCGGTHLQSLSEINLLKVLGTEKDRSALRVRFVAGQRALTYFQSCVIREASLSAKLSVPAADHVAAVDKLQKERKDMAKRIETYADELADFWGQSLVATAPSGPGVVVKHREGADLKFLLRAASKAQEVRPDIIILISGEENPGNKSTEGITGPFVLFGNPAVVNKAKESVLKLLGARGGGKPGKLQGFGTKLEVVNQAQEILQENL